MTKRPIITGDMTTPGKRAKPAPQRGQEPTDKPRRVTILLDPADLKRLKLAAIETGKSQQALVESAIQTMLKKEGF